MVACFFIEKGSKYNSDMCIKVVELIKRNKMILLIILLGIMLLAGSYSFFSIIYVNVVAPPKFLSSKAVQYRFLQIKLPEITYNYYYSDFQKDILKYKSLSIYQDFVENENGAAIYLNDSSFSNLELTEGRHFLAEDKENKTNTVMISEALLTKCEIFNGKKSFHFDGEYYEVIGVYKEHHSIPKYYVNMFAENLSHNILNGYICIDGNKEDIASLINSIKNSFSGNNNGIDITQTEDYEKHDIIYFLHYLLFENAIYTLIILTPLILLFLNINGVIRHSLNLRYNELYSRFLSGADINKIRRQLALETMLLAILINLILFAIIILFQVESINIVYFSLYSLFFHIFIFIIILKHTNILLHNEINKKTTFDSRSIILRSCKFFMSYKCINFMVIMLMVIICFMSGLATHEYIILDKVEEDISNITVYDNLYSMKRSSESGNYNLNTIYSENELECNKLLYKFLENNYTVYSCYPAFEAEEELIDNKVISKYYYNLEFKKNIMQELSFALSDETKVTEETGFIPVILGWNYHKHKLGEIINNKYIVCGIMKAGAFFYDLKYNYTPIYMDDLIFEYINTSAMDTVDYSFLISDIKIITNNKKELNRINNYAHRIGMDKFEFIKDTDKINDFKKDYKIVSDLEYYLLLCIISLILVLTYVYTYLKFRETKKQIDLMHIIGIPYKDLLFSILLEALLHIVLIILIVAFINYFLKIIISVAWWHTFSLLTLYLGIVCMLYIGLFKGEFEQ